MRHRAKGGRDTDRRTVHLESGPDSHLLYYSIPDRTLYTSGDKRRVLEAILVRLEKRSPRRKRRLT